MTTAEASQTDAQTAVDEAKQAEAQAESKADSTQATTDDKQSAVDAQQSAVDQATKSQSEAQTTVDSAQKNVSDAQSATKTAKDQVSSAQDSIAQNAADQDSQQQTIEELSDQKANAEEMIPVTKATQDYTNEFSDSDFTETQTVTQDYNPDYVPNYDKVREYFTLYLNQLREVNGQPALTMTDDMNTVAQTRADAQTGDLSHNGSGAYTENLSDTDPYAMSDQELAYWLVQGWYDESENMTPAGELGHYGHRLNEIYVQGTFGLGFNATNGRVALDIDDSELLDIPGGAYGDTLVEMNKMESSKAAPDTVSLPNIIFTYVTMEERDPQKAAELAAELTVAQSKLDDVKNDAAELQDKLSDAKATLTATQSKEKSTEDVLDQAQNKLADAKSVTDTAQSALANLQTAYKSAKAVSDKAAQEYEAAKKCDAEGQ